MHTDPKYKARATEGPFGTPLFEVFASRARSLNWRVYELKAGHAAMLTHPKESANILLKIVDGIH